MDIYQSYANYLDLDQSLTRTVTDRLEEVCKKGYSLKAVGLATKVVFASLNDAFQNTGVAIAHTVTLLCRKVGRLVGLGGEIPPHLRMQFVAWRLVRAVAFAVFAALSVITSPMIIGAPHLVVKSCDLFKLRKPFAAEKLAQKIQTLHESYQKGFAQASDDGGNIPAQLKGIKELMSCLRVKIAGDVTEPKSFGPKHMNNVLLERLAEAVNIPGLSVPKSQGVDSEKFLKTYAPDVFKSMEALDALYSQYKGSERFLDLPHVKDHLKGIDAAIAQVFNSENAFEKLASPETLEAFLAWVDASNDYLMVRSTGAEDSAESANAGGNISKAYVSAKKKEWCCAVGDVVRSYFQASSLQNRINANQNPFKQPFQVAVTTQPLIGEPIGGAKDPADIPISLVLFSNESLYTGGEKFRVMRFSSSYGHGEGVVGNVGIATDTVTVLISENTGKPWVLYDNKDKPYRLAPVLDKNGRVVLGKLANPPELRNKPALKPEMLATLSAWAAVVDPFFGNDATDHEFVIKKGCVYPVQARPVKRPKLEPTYLNMRKVEGAKTSPISETLQAEEFIPGKASLVPITRRKEILVASTLEEAEGIYKKELHKLIVVNQHGPANSHPVVNFSSLGVPCLVASDMGEVDRLLAKVDTKHPLAVCVQTAALHLWDNSKGTIGSFTAKGFAVHPAKIAISLPTQLTGPMTAPSRDVPKDVKTLLVAVRAATTKKVALQKLKELQENSWVAKVWQQNKRVKLALSSDSVHPVIRERFEAIRAFSKELKKAFKEAEATTHRLSAGEHLKPLLHAKILSELLIGNAHKAGSIGQLSAVDIFSLSDETNQLIAYQKDLSHPAHLMDLLLFGNKGLSDETRAEWRDFLMHVETLVETGKVSSTQLDNFKKFIQTLHQAETLPLWLAFEFKKLWPSISTSSESWGTWAVSRVLGKTPENALLQKCINTLPAKDLPFIRQQLQLKEELLNQHNQTHLFADPSSFDAAFKTLKDYVDPVVQRTLCKQMGSVSGLSRMIALGSMGELVDLFDGAIKAMKVSEKWPNDKKVELFKEMLKVYLTLLKTWHAHSSDLKDIKTHVGWPRKKYLDKLESILNTLPSRGEEQLSPSRDFSVAAAVMSSGTWFDRHLPETLEDVFTLIHQNLTLCISWTNNKLISKKTVAESSLPDSFKMAMQKLSSVSYSEKQMCQTGLEVTENRAVAKYNIALDNHAAQVELIYDKEKGDMRFDLHFFGAARMRWVCNRVLAKMSEELGFCQPAESVWHTQQEMGISWKITGEEGLKYPLALFEDMMTMCTSTNLALLKDWRVEWDSRFFNHVANIAKDDPDAINRKAALEIIQENLAKSIYPMATTAANTALSDSDVEVQNAGKELLASIEAGVEWLTVHRRMRQKKQSWWPF